MKRIALTLDDGPSQWTTPILELLAQHHAHATFFVLGAQAVAHPAVLEQTVSGGHELGPHGWDHKAVEDIDYPEILDRLANTCEQIALAGATQIRWWRPPWHRLTKPAIRAATDLGLSYCRSTVDTYDVNRSVDRICKTVYEEVADGSIVGLHDGIASNGNHETPHRWNTVKAVERILRTMSGEYEFCTVSELLGS